MFRALALLVVALLVGATIIFYIMHKHVRPYLNAKHIRQLEEENRRLDNLIKLDQPRRRTTLK